QQGDERHSHISRARVARRGGGESRKRRRVAEDAGDERRYVTWRIDIYRAVRAVPRCRWTGDTTRNPSLGAPLLFDRCVAGAYRARGVVHQTQHAVRFGWRIERSASIRRRGVRRVSSATRFTRERDGLAEWRCTAG